MENSILNEKAYSILNKMYQALPTNEALSEKGDEIKSVLIALKTSETIIECQEEKIKLLEKENVNIHNIYDQAIKTFNK